MQILNNVSHVERMLFTKHLAIMLKSGIPITEAVEVLGGQTRNPTLKKILTDVARGIHNGQTLVKNLKRYPRVFDGLYTSVIGIGEESGTLEKNLEYLAAQQEKAYEFRKKVQAAMMYPMLVVAIAVSVGVGIAFFVLPQLVDLFSSLDVQLPMSTRILLGIAYVTKNYGVGLLVGTGVAAMAGVWLVRKPGVKAVWHKGALRLPIFGMFFQDMQTAMFCRNLGLMLAGGLHITGALKSCGEAASNMEYRKYILKLAAAVDKGKSMEKELMEKDYAYLPVIVPRMIGVGERSGKLDEVLMYLADFFEEEVDNTAKNLSTILEPIMLVAIAAMVGFLAMSIITPIYQFTSAVRR